MSGCKDFYNNYDITHLNNDEFINLWIKYKKGDKQARDKIIICNLKLIYKIVSGFNGYNINEDDLISVGILALISCLDNYDLSKKYKFSTYISKCVKNSILDYIKKQCNICYSLNESFGFDSEDQILDFISDSIAVDDMICDRTLYENIIEIINDFPVRERNIMYDYFINYDECSMSMEEIGKKYGINKARVSRIIIKSLDIIRTKLEIYNKKTM